MKVQVLMSSYNGEQFIEEQINSILSQSNIEMSLLIRDDGSTDNTPNILRRKASEDSRVKILLEQNIGVKKSFLKLIKMAETNYDYYAFSDQDDIWLPLKIYKAVNTLSAQNQSIPLVYGSPVLLYANGNIIGEQFRCPTPRFGNFLVKNYYPGCTMVFNKELCKLINMIDYTDLNPFPLHDHWLNLVCTACGGKVIIDNESYILYRQHDSNVVGDRNIVEKIKGNGLFSRSNNTRYQICSELNKNYNEQLCTEAVKTVDTIMRYRKGLDKKVKLALSKEVKPFSIIEKISLFFIVMLEKF